jgi:hypothetical protein
MLGILVTLVVGALSVLLVICPFKVRFNPSVFVTFIAYSIMRLPNNIHFVTVSVGN